MTDQQPERNQSDTNNVVPLRIPTKQSEQSFITKHFIRGDQVELAEAVLSDLEKTGQLTYDEGEIRRYSYQSGVWNLIRDEVVENMVRDYAGSPLITNKRLEPLKIQASTIKGTVDIIRSSLIGRERRPLFEDAVAGVSFRNGFAVVEKGGIKLHPHHPRFMARHGFDFDYIPNRPHPNLDQFFRDIFTDADDSWARRTLLQQFVGGCLVGIATKYQRCALLYGEGDNGKSQTLELAESTFSKSNIVTVPPQDWGRPFHISCLVGAKINIVNEIPEHEIVSGSLFKSVISGEPVLAERKFKDPFRFRPTAGHLFSANRLPPTADHSHGFWRRIMVIPLTRNIREAPCHRAYAARHVIETELPGIVGWALEGALLLENLGEYVEPDTSADIINRWRRDVDSVKGFVNEEYEVDTSSSVSAQSLYREYAVWTTENGLKAVSSPTFWKRLNGLGYKSKHTKTGNVYELKKKTTGTRFDGFSRQTVGSEGC